MYAQLSMYNGKQDRIHIFNPNGSLWTPSYSIVKQPLLTVASFRYR